MYMNLFYFVILRKIFLSWAECHNYTTINMTQDTTANALCRITTLVDTNHGFIESANYPSPYFTPCEWHYIVNVGNGLSVQMNLLHFNININAGDELTFQPQCSSYNKCYGNHHHRSNNSNNTTGFTFTCCDRILIKFVATARPVNTHTGFKIQFQTSGGGGGGGVWNWIDEKEERERKTYGWIQLFLLGYNDWKYHEFRYALSKMAQKYCKQHITSMPTPSINKLNQSIVFNRIESCYWESECTQFNISIILGNSNLSAQQLQEMWKFYRDDEEITKLQIMEYELTDFQSFLLFWIIVTSSMSVMFIVIIVIVIKSKLINLYFERLENTNDDGWMNFQKEVPAVPSNCLPNECKTCHIYERLSRPKGIFELPRERNIEHQCTNKKPCTRSPMPLPCPLPSIHERSLQEFAKYRSRDYENEFSDVGSNYNYYSIMTPSSSVKPPTTPLELEIK